MRVRISLGFFFLGVLFLSMDPLAGQPGGGKEGKRSFTFNPGGGVPPGGAPMAPGGFPQPGGERTRSFQFQPGGGQPGAAPGGGFNRGGGGMDPEMQWNMMLKITGGTDSLDLSRVPPESKQFIRSMAERNGTMPLPEAGVWNKAQFMDFAVRNQELMRAKQAGAPPGAAPGAFAPPGGQPAFGQPGSFQMQPGQFGGPGNFGGNKGMSDEDAVRRFKESDRDQDGRLSWEEASSKSRENWQEIDVNADRYIDLDEYRGYIARRYGPNAQPQNGQPPYGAQPQYGYGPQPSGNDFREGDRRDRRDEKKDDFTNVAIRYGKLPPGLPDWFAECDTDKDGQVNMYEWRTVKGESVAAFREKDANGDGFIAPLELIRVEATKAETERLIAIQEGETPPGTSRTKGGSMSGGGKTGGFPGFGGGATPMGKGGPPSSDARPREEKRDEKVDRTKAGPWSNGGKK